MPGDPSKYGYLVAYLDESGLDDGLFAKAIDAMTGQVLEQFTLDTHGTFSAPALFGRATMYDSDPVDDVLAVYAEVDAVAGGDVLAAMSDGVGGEQEDHVFTGCFGAGEPRASAARSPNAKHRHELWDVEPGAACILGIGWAEEQIDLGAGTLVPDLDQMIAVVAGTADVNGFVGTKVPIPAGLAGSTFWFQWAVIPSAAPCTSLGIDLADAIEIVVE